MWKKRVVRVVYACTYDEEVVVLRSRQCCLGLGSRAPRTLLHHHGAVYATVGFGQYVSN